MPKKSKTILIHSIAWIGYLLLPVLIIPKPIIQPKEAEMIDFVRFSLLLTSNLALIGFYYFNYFILVPKLLFYKKYLLYVCICIISAVIIFFFPIVFFPKPKFLIPIPEQEILGMRLIQVLFMYLVILFASISSRFSTEWRTSEEKRKIAENERLNAELLSLKSQINPHFLFNTLNTIYALSVNKSNNTPEAVMKLSALMRYTISETHHQFIDLTKEISYIESYISLQRLRLSERVNVQYTFTGAHNSDKIAPLLLIPFIENAFKFGVSNETDSLISIFISVNSHRLTLEVINNIMTENKRVNETTGIGLSNARKRLELIYENKYDLGLGIENDLYKVKLQIRLD